MMVTALLSVMLFSSMNEVRELQRSRKVDARTIIFLEAQLKAELQKQKRAKL